MATSGAATRVVMPLFGSTVEQGTPSVTMAPTLENLQQIVDATVQQVNPPPPPPQNPQQ